LSFQIGTRIGRFSLKIKPRGSNTEEPEASTDSGSNESTNPTPNFRDGSVNQQHQSLLFKLPTELRLSIYEHVLRLPYEGGSYRQIVRHHSCERHRSNSVLNVLATCRLIQHEAEELFYTQNTLRIKQPADFCKSSSARRRGAINNLVICVASPGEMLVQLEALQGFPNLETLVVERLISIKFTEPRTWAVLTPNYVAEVKKLAKLRSIRLVTPRDEQLTEHEMERLKKLEFHDAKIVAAVTGASMLETSSAKSGVGS
jgi:hypothetical protein